MTGEVGTAGPACCDAAAWVDGVPIAAGEIDERLARVRARDRASALPPDGSREGRQLRRWVTQVAVVERICEAEAGAGTAGEAQGQSGAEADTGSAGLHSARSPSRAEAVAAGSILAAAWTSNPAVRRVAERVTADVVLSPADRARAARLAATGDGETVWSADELLRSARMEAFARWLARATHERVRLAPGYEHPGDASQPDNVHEH